MSDEVKVRRSSDGAIITVTRKAWEVVLSSSGFELVGADEEKPKRAGRTTKR